MHHTCGQVHHSARHHPDEQRANDPQGGCGERTCDRKIYGIDLHNICLQQLLSKTKKLPVCSTVQHECHRHDPDLAAFSICQHTVTVRKLANCQGQFNTPDSVKRRDVSGCLVDGKMLSSAGHSRPCVTAQVELRKYFHDFRNCIYGRVLRRVGNIVY